MDDNIRALPVPLMSFGATIETCTAAAKAQGLQYAGLQYSGYCYGGNTLQYSSVPDSECNMPCYSNPSEMCGGNYRNSIYSTEGVQGALAVCLRHDPLGRIVLVGYTELSAVSPDSLSCMTDASVKAPIARFKYDARGRRIARQDAATGQWTYIMSDPAGNPLSELQLTEGVWTRVRDYVWLDGRPLAQVEYPGPTPQGEGYAYYFHLDHIGLPRAMTNAAGQLVWNTFPRPYGDIAEKTMTDPLSGRVVVTNLRLPGQYDERLLGSLGLQGPYYNWNRWYLPGVGRYLELDPIALRGKFNGRYGLDWYGYALANPLRFGDPLGLSVTCTYHQSTGAMT
jgi:RHS repeat-associated protein